MTYEEAAQLYRSEERRYYEYCGYISSYERQIAEYRSERHNKSIMAHDKRQDIRKNESILQSINNASATKSEMFQHLSNIDSKVKDAASNYSKMISSSSVKAFNLEQKYGVSATNENSRLSNIFNEIATAKNTISGVIESLNQEVRSLESRITELDYAIDGAYSAISEHENSKQHCLINMAYYRRVMTQLL